MGELKLCVNCRHFKDRECMAPQAFVNVDLVTGGIIREWEYARTHRLHSADKSTCGVAAQWFEEKPVEARKNSFFRKLFGCKQ